MPTRACWGSDKNPDGRWREYGYEELVNRDKASLDIFWLRDESLSDSDNLPAPEVIAAEIVEDLEAAAGTVSGDSRGHEHKRSAVAKFDRALASPTREAAEHAADQA